MPSGMNKFSQLMWENTEHVGGHLPGKLYWFDSAWQGFASPPQLDCLLIFTFTLGSSNICFCPKQLTISTFVTREKLRHSIKEKRRK